MIDKKRLNPLVLDLRNVYAAGLRAQPCRRTDAGTFPASRKWRRDLSLEEAISLVPGQTHISIFIGEDAGCDGLDIDRKNGKDGFKSLQDAGIILPDGPSCITPHGGEHRIAGRNIELEGVKNGDVLPGVEIKCKGQIVWYGRFPIVEKKNLPVLPSVLVSLIVKAKQKRETELPPDKLKDGMRHVALIRLAGILRGQGMSEQEMREQLTRENEARCEPLLTAADINGFVVSAMGWPAGQETHCTEGAAGQIFAGLHNASTRFDWGVSAWYIWDKRRWAIDGSGKIYGLMPLVVDEYRALSNDVTRTQEKRLAFSKYILRLEKKQEILNVLWFASIDPRLAISGNSWDSNPLLLNCLNGTLDLDTMKLSPHDSGQNLSRMCQAEYNPKAVCVKWVKFLSEILPEKELRQFMQRVIGYCLSGLTDEQVFFFLWGSGSNGKSVFISLIEELLGDYATRLRTETLMKHGERHDLIRLRAARFAVASELDVNETLAEGQVKDMCGQDTLIVRIPYGKYSSEFKTPAKVFLVGNHKPRVLGTDHAMWRRIMLVPFSQVISPAKRRPETELLKGFRGELSGILNWALTGWRDCQAGGLQPPAAVKAAVEEYRREEDRLSDFLEMYEHSTSESISFKGLFMDYANWATAEIARTMSRRAFSAAIQERGYVVFAGTDNERLVRARRKNR